MLKLESRVVAHIVIIAAVAVCSCGEDPVNPDPPIGECGEYAELVGHVTVVSVTELPESAADPDRCYLGYAVVFRLEGDIGEHCIPCGYGPEITLLLNNGWPLGPQYLAKYGITEGGSIAIAANVQIDGCGPCPPCSFEFTGVDLNDLFECRKG